MLILITYDLKQPNRDYSSLYESIKSCGTTWWHFLESVWIIHTNDLDPNECYHRIRECIDDKDNLLVVDITNRNRQGWLPSKAWDWIRQNDY